MLKSFRTRLILFILLLLALAQFGTALAVLSSLKEANYKQGVQSINVSRNVFDLFLESRAEQLTQGVEILTSDFGFKQAVATRETSTIGSVLKNHGARINADISLLVSSNGTLITATQDIGENSTIAQLVLAARRSGGSSISTMIAFDGTAYQLVLVPIKAPNIIAWIGMAFQLDQTLAEQIKAVTGLDISFVNENDPLHLMSGGSTLPPQEKIQIFDSIGNVENILQYPAFSTDEKYLSLGVDIGVPQQWGIIHLPYGPWLQSYNNTRNQLMWIFTGALALALLLGIALARNMTQPIQTLVEYARQIGMGGNKSRRNAPQIWGEFGVLSNTMETMQESIVCREELLTHRASHDQLTGLFNQSAVESYLVEALSKTQGGLMLVNLRHFKRTNNMLGFDVGNVLLSKVALRLQSWSNDVTMLARLSGDKFLFVFERPVQQKDCESLKQCFVQEFDISSDSSIRLEISIAVLPFEHATQDVNSAMRRLEIVADKARENKDLCEFYEEGQDENHRRQLTIIRDLPTALDNNELFVVYQPKVCLLSDSCHESEALIRWIHPELGFIPPDEFIALLEHAGSIQILTKWVLNTVLSQLNVWQQQGEEMRVAVNLSAHDLLDETLPTMVAEALEANQLPASALALEVTESAVMKDREKVITVLNALQDMGVHLAIDDFGTGQSSLAYLRELPVNEVKIDRAFIQFIDTNKKDEFITTATIDLSHSLGFSVTAEGAENAAAVALLKHCRCDKIQGYFFSKPLAANDFLLWRNAFNGS